MNIEDLAGVGEKRAKDFKKLGIENTAQLCSYFPRAYLDMTSRVSVFETYHNELALVACTLTYVEPVRYAGRLKTVRAHLSQDGRSFTAVWFNMPYVAKRLKAGEYLFYGRVNNKYGQISLVNPSFEPLGSVSRLKGLVPVYGLSGSLTQKVVRDAVQRALKIEEHISIIPADLCKKYALSPLNQAYFAVHAPKTQKEMQSAAERIAVEEYFTLVSAFKLIKGDRKEARGRTYAVTEEEVAEFEKRFHFTFTAGQREAVRVIFNNLKSPVRMNRLLQGDVGSGKTAVALTGIFMALKSGFQAAYLSPTEVLAEQNFRLLEKIFPEYKVAYLAGSCTAKEKREIKAALKAGEYDVLCGTHAVLQSDVVFKNLAFCVCDEQHRFGVAQRNILSEKGDNADVLVMSATPIPRTLSLIFYGDLDITVIKDKPVGRQEISTSIIPAYKYDDMLEYIAGETKKGKQAYFVCSKIDDDEGQVTSVKELFEELRGRLPSVRFALLHGRMKEKEKTEIMTAFKRGEYDCLVSTTVIEVGVDVPNATIMAIYNAERFGLSQLHQLRGRVGRGEDKSYCFLLIGSETEAAYERLRLFKSTNDGFELAERDLEMRGGGDFLGIRQSGRFLSEIKNLRYTKEAVFLAKQLSDEAFERSDLGEIRRAAMKKYESLKDVVLN